MHVTVSAKNWGLKPFRFSVNCPFWEFLFRKSGQSLLCQARESTEGKFPRFSAKKAKILSSPFLCIFFTCTKWLPLNTQKQLICYGLVYNQGGAVGCRPGIFDSIEISMSRVHSPIAPPYLVYTQIMLFRNHYALRNRASYQYLVPDQVANIGKSQACRITGNDLTSYIA